MENDSQGGKSHVAQFLLDLTNDPDKREHFDTFKKMMDDAGLDEADRAVVLSGDSERVRKHLGDDDPPGCLIIFPFI